MHGVGPRMVPRLSLRLILQKNSRSSYLIVREEVRNRVSGATVGISETIAEISEPAAEVLERVTEDSEEAAEASEVTIEEAEQTTVVFPREANIERKALQSANKYGLQRIEV